MFHWICPECGQEIAPGVKECPVCEPQASASSPLPSGGQSITAAPVAVVPKPAEPVAAVLERLAPPVMLPTVQLAKQTTPVAEPMPVAQQPVVRSGVRESAEQPVQKPKVVLQPEVLLRPEAILQAKAFHGPNPPVILDAIPAEARPVLMPDVPLGTSPVELPDPLLEPASNGAPPPGTFADRLADLADLLHAERIPYAAPQIFQESAAPGPHLAKGTEKTPVIVDVTFHEESPRNGAPTPVLLAAPPSLLLLEEPQPPSIAPAIPIETFGPRLAAQAVQSPQAMEAEPIAASPVRLPESPNRAAAPALAPLEDYSETAERLVRPVEHGTKPASSRALPTVTLPGPALPRELMSLQAAGLVPIRKGGKRGDAAPSGSGGATKYIIAVAMLLTAGAATYSLMPAPSASAPSSPAPETAPEPPVSVQAARPANSLARLVEVTGVRFMEVNNKPQIHYLVVNHSNAPLHSMTVYVTLRASSAKPGQPPIAKITFRSPALAAFEAKEMFSSIERATAPVDLPDWQDLRADVDVQ